MVSFLETFPASAVCLSPPDDSLDRYRPSHHLHCPELLAQLLKLTTLRPSPRLVANDANLPPTTPRWPTRKPAYHIRQESGKQAQLRDHTDTLPPIRHKS